MERSRDINEIPGLECAGLEESRLIQRAAPLVFGIFGTIGAGTDGAEVHEVQGGGSGIVIAPFLALTARHVAKDLYRLEGREAPRWPHQSAHAAHLFQVLDPINNPSVSSAAPLWHVDRSWASSHTDIILLQVSAESEVIKAQPPSRFFEWRLLPPPVGSIVWAIGFPQLDIRPDGRYVTCGVRFTLQGLHVTKIYPLLRDRGMLNFPCFEVDEYLDHGFSGGPVFYEGKLCGLVSSGRNFEGERRSYIASPWPLTLMDYSNETGQQTRFGDLLERGVIVGSDWQITRRIISKGEDELGNPCVFIDTTGI